jgi:hypothetical protein
MHRLALLYILILIPGPVTAADPCAEDELIHHHDGTFEQGFSGCCGWNQEPYYGAWGEAYDLGPGTIGCAVYWITTIPNQYQGELADCYIWEGGVHTATGNILAVIYGVAFESIPIWPEVGANYVEFNLHVEGEFTAGYWGVWPDAPHGFKCAVDLDGPGGHPLCYVAPSLTEDWGWQDPHDYFYPEQPTQAMGIGLTFDADPNPAQFSTWGSIKAFE